MKKVIVLLVVLSVGFTYAQDKNEPKLEKKNDTTLATYYHDNGQIQQVGTFNSKGKLHGEWASFDENGNKLALGTYENGIKKGKWFFWQDDVLKEVDYIDSKIVNVSEWSNKNDIALRN